MLTTNETRLLHALKARSGREKHRAFVAEGVRIVEEALSAGVDLEFAVISPTLEDSGRGRALAERLDANTRVERVSDKQLHDIAETDSTFGFRGSFMSSTTMPTSAVT